MRSVVVVLPASMCAMIPIFLQRSNGTVLATISASFWGSLKSAFGSWLSALGFRLLAFGSWLLAKGQEHKAVCLPAIMRERLIGIGHTMHVFLLLDGRAFSVCRVQQLVRQLFHHALFAASASIRKQPADRQRSPAVGIDFNGNLVVRSTDATTLHFEQRLGIFDSLGEQLHGLVAALFLQLRQRLIKDGLGGALFALIHHAVDELRYQVGVVNSIRINRALRDVSFSRHSLLSLTSLLLWGAWRHISSGSASGRLHPPNQACHVLRDNARRGGLLHDHRG